jgi:deoxycytidylate deaminase
MPKQCNLEEWRVRHSPVGATLYITLSPCKECSKLIHQSGIREWSILNGYRDDSGIQFLLKSRSRSRTYSRTTIIMKSNAKYLPMLLVATLALGIILVDG